MSDEHRTNGDGTAGNDASPANPDSSTESKATDFEVIESLETTDGVVSESSKDTDSVVLSDEDVPLAVVVEKANTEVAIASLESEGVYDTSRRVRTYGPETVSLPITDPPRNTNVLEVIQQIDPEYRVRDLETLLGVRGWTDAELETVPGSWAVVGSVVLVRVPEGCPDETALAEALLEIQGDAETVLADDGVANEGESGIFREPRTRHLAGERDTETVHVEHGTHYGLDPSKVMFAPGNQAERVRMGEVVDPTERVFDMFAGIGYFTLPMARAGANVTAAEINPTAFRYLLENAMRNDVSDRIDAYRTDCRELAASVDADRVVMGYYGAASGSEGGRCEADTDDRTSRTAENHGMRTNEAHAFLPYALAALEPGGVVHYHEATPEPLLWDRPLTRLENAVVDAGRELTILEKRRVKSHSAGVEHLVLDAQVD